MNTITVKGRLGRDPEMRYGSSGKPFTRFSVADGHKAKDGTETTVWWDVTLFGEDAEWANDTLRKGSLVTVKGRAMPKVSPSNGKCYHAVEFAKVETEEEPRTREEDDLSSLPF